LTVTTERALPALELKRVVTAVAVGDLADVVANVLEDRRTRRSIADGDRPAPYGLKATGLVNRRLRRARLGCRFVAFFDCCGTGG